MYTLSALHAILESRRQFIPRGVANDPAWNVQDLITLSEILSNILNK